MGCSCADCWQWFVELVLRDELTESDTYEPPDAEENGGDDGKVVDLPDIEKLTRVDEPYRQDRMRQLFNRHGYNLAIFPGGHVRGVREAFNPHAVLEVLAVSVGQVQIRFVETGLFLSMGPEGRLYGTKNPSNMDTVFVEKKLGPYLTYLNRSNAHLGWHVGIQQNGQPKNGRMTAYPWGQKAVSFVSRRPYAEHHPVRQLRNRHGFKLAVGSDGKVRGSKSETFDRHTVLELIPSVPPGAFRIRGVTADLYLAMDNKGRLYGDKDRNSENTLFAEHPSQGRYFTYLSVRWSHLGWHVGIKKSGIAKNATKTVYPSGQKAIQFEHLRPYPAAPTEEDLGKALGEAANDQNSKINNLELNDMAFIDDDVDDVQK